MKDLAKLKALHREITTAREARIHEWVEYIHAQAI